MLEPGVEIAKSGSGHAREPDLWRGGARNRFPTAASSLFFCSGSPALTGSNINAARTASAARQAPHARAYCAPFRRATSGVASDESLACRTPALPQHVPARARARVPSRRRVRREPRDICARPRRALHRATQCRLSRLLICCRGSPPAEFFVCRQRSTSRPIRVTSWRRRART